MANKKDDYNEILVSADKKLPYSLEAEQAVLGSALVDPESVGRIATALRPENFYVTKHKEIFDCIMEMYSLSIPVEAILLLEKMREKGYYKGDDDKAYLLSLAEISSRIGNIEYYIKIVMEKAKLREVILICEKVNSLCYDNHELAEVLDMAEGSLYNIRMGRKNDRTQRLQDVVSSEMTVLKEISGDTTGKFEPIKAEISTFDNFLGGLNRSDLIILAARPGVGKTSFALNVAYNIAASSRYSPKKEIVFFSLEMSNSQLAKRIISSNLMIDSEKLRLGTLEDSQWNDIYDFWHDTLPDVNFYMDDTTSLTVLDMKSKLRKFNNLGLVVIDYLQLMQSNRKNENRNQEISEITRAIKIMAKELEVPVMLLSQLSRGIESRGKEDRAPRLSDLRDSGSIEQDADIVIFLSRPEYFDKETAQRNYCDLYIEKNRHGKTGKIGLQWDGSHTSFKATSYEPVPDDLI